MRGGYFIQVQALCVLLISLISSASVTICIGETWQHRMQEIRNHFFRHCKEMAGVGWALTHTAARVDLPVLASITMR